MRQNKSRGSGLEQPKQSDEKEPIHGEPDRGDPQGSRCEDESGGSVPRARTATKFRAHWELLTACRPEQERHHKTASEALVKLENGVQRAQRGRKVEYKGVVLCTWRRQLELLNKKHKAFCLSVDGGKYAFWNSKFQPAIFNNYTPE